MVRWEEMTEEQKKNCYESYVGECIYEDGDNAKRMTYDEWCKESEAMGEAWI